MPVVQYLVKLSISLSVIWLFYAIVLRHLTFYNWNRWYLLCYSLLAFYIPFIDISGLLQQSTLNQNGIVQFIPVVDTYTSIYVVHRPATAPVSRFTISDGLLLIFVTGVVVLMSRLLIQYLSFLRVKRKAKLLVNDGVKIYQVNKNIIPFSFGNEIFINQHQHSEEELKEIIRHEFIHVKQKHTVDILWAELLCIINWYNPFVWLIRKSIRQNLEFIADYNVLQGGIDKKHYQYLLLKVIGAPQFSIAQQFNFSSLKKRIAMMNKVKSARLQLIRFLFLLPLVAVLLLAFRDTVIHNTPAAPAKVKPAPVAINEAPAEINNDTLPAYHPLRWSNDFLEKHTNIKNIGWVIGDKMGRPAKLHLFFKNNTEQVFDLRKPGELAAFEKTYGKVPGIQSATASRETSPIITMPDTAFFMDASLDVPERSYYPPATIAIRGMNAFRDSIQPLYIIDGVRQPLGGKTLDKISPEDIVSIEVLKNESAVNIYGEEGRNGVINITTRYFSNVKVIPGMDEIGKIDRSLFNSVGLIVVDGKIFDENNFDELSLQPDNIQSITILRDKSATSLYGSRAEKGVIIIETKGGKGVSPYKDARLYSETDSLLISLRNYKGLIVVDETQYDAVSFQKLNLAPTDIRAIFIYPVREATLLYGDKGAQGATKILTKKNKRVAYGDKKPLPFTAAQAEQPIQMTASRDFSTHRLVSPPAGMPELIVYNI